MVGAAALPACRILFLEGDAHTPCVMAPLLRRRAAAAQQKRQQFQAGAGDVTM
jgi:hypothetical protein